MNFEKNGSSSGRRPGKTNSLAFGQASLVTANATVWNDDLEEELASWPSMVAALTADGQTLRQRKNLYAYRNAVLEANLEDLPATLRLAIESIARFNQPEPPETA